MRRLLATLLIVVAGSAAQQAPPPPVEEVFRAFDRIAAQPLWPGFEPRSVAVEVFDGVNTYLFHHPKPSEGFHAVPGAPGVFVYPGQHETVRANTGTEVNGVPTATADISKGRRTVAEIASLLIHESFHVFQGQAHPKWAANEADLFLYPLDDWELLSWRRIETLELLRALRTRREAEARCWAGAALATRKERFARMPAGAAAYERGTELHEGLAQYVEYQSIHKPEALTAEDFPAGIIRQRGYATGQAFALLLDRFGGDWKSQRGDGPLDELLRSRVTSAKRCALPEAETSAQVERAKREVEQLVAGRRQRRQEFLDAPGWRIEIIAGKESLWPQGFDPWNVTNLGDNLVLHTRWVKLGNASGTIEVLDHASLTEGAGPHPLFNGARKLTVTGLAEPKVTEAGGRVTLDVPGAKGTLTGTLERDAQTFRIRLP